MLDESLSYPTEREDLVETYLVGSLLVLVTGVIGITAIPLQGYYLRAFEAGTTGESGPPEFDEWGDMVVDGLKLLLVGLVYVGIPAVLFTVGLTMVLLALVFGVVAESAVTTGLGAVAVVVLVVGFGALLLVGSYLIPAAIGTMLAEDSVGAAFRLQTVVGVATQSEYVTAVLVGWVVGFVISLVGSMLSILLVGLPVLVYGGLFVNHMFGRGYAKARAAQERQPSPATEVGR